MMQTKKVIKTFLNLIHMNILVVVQFMLASGRMGRDMGEENYTTKWEQFMKDIGEMVKHSIIILKCLF